MFTFAVLSCLIVKAIDGSVVREQENPLNGLIQNLELTEDTDIAMMLEGSYPRLGRETTQTPGSDETARHNSLYMRFGRAALVFTDESESNSGDQRRYTCWKMSSRIHQEWYILF